MLRTRCRILLLACLAVTSGHPAFAASDPLPTTRDAVTTISFLEPALAANRIEVTELTPSAAGVEQHALSVTPASAPAFATGEPWGLRFTAPEGHFDDFAGGSLRHRGGFALCWPGGEASFLGFELRPGPEPRTLELLDVGGEVAFRGDHLHYELDAERGWLQIFNVDLSFSDSFAERLGRPDLAGRVAGVLTVTAGVDGLEGAPRGGCPPNWDGIVDVALIGMNDVEQVERAGGQVVITPSARLKNVGTADVPWYAKFSGNFPPYDNDQHPFLVWALYRIQDGVMRKLAVSDVKARLPDHQLQLHGCGLEATSWGSAARTSTGCSQTRTTTISRPVPRSAPVTASGPTATSPSPTPPLISIKTATAPRTTPEKARTSSATAWWSTRSS